MTTLLTVLGRLEQELHHPGARCSIDRLEHLLHPEFHEVGRSGRRYDRPTVIAFLAGPVEPPKVASDDFKVTPLAETAALLTYRSAHLLPDGSLSDHTLRSSLWVKHGESWLLLYHQGTPAAELW